MRILFAITFFLSNFLHPGLGITSEIYVSKIEGSVNWDGEDNYIEAKKIAEAVKKISEDRQKTQQLQKTTATSNNKDNKTIKNKQAISTNRRNELQELKTNNNKIDNEEISSEKKHDIKNNNVIINDYISPNGDNHDHVNKQNQDSKNINQNNKSEVIDLSIMPNVPKIVGLKQGVVINKHRGNNDFKFQRMLQKVNKNIDDSQNFALFAKEAAKMVYNKSEELTLDMPNIKESYVQKKDPLKHNTNANIYNDNLRNVYAIAEKAIEKKESIVENHKKNSRNTDIQNYSINSANKKNDNASSKTHESNIDIMQDNDGSALVEEFEDDAEDSLEKKQIRAKNIGAPYPLKRSKNNHMTQYSPQNISQVVYDKNNSHLAPIVFKENIVEDVIKNLDTDDPVRLAHALIDKFGNVDIADKNGNTILMHAVARRNQALVSMLLSEGANPNAINEDGFAPTHLAASNGDDDSIYSLITNGGDPNLQDINGNTPLMYASKMCNNDSVDIMITFGGNPELTNNAGNTAYDFANENKNPNIYKSLKTASKKIYGKKKPINLNE